MREIEYYPEICDYLSKGLSHSLSILGDFCVDFQPCGTIDMASGFSTLLDRTNTTEDSFNMNRELVRGLFIDILGGIYSRKSSNGTLVICEVKIGDLTLTHLAQLMGYCIASRIPYGLLISIDGRITSGFENILKANPHLLKLRINREAYLLGIGNWNSNTSEIVFDSLGKIKSLVGLSRSIGTKLNKS